MRRGNTRATIAATAALLIFGLAVSPAALAQQGGGGGRGGRGGFGGPGGPGMLGGPMGGALRDPSHSAEAILLQRDDVQHELMLDGRQQEQISDVVKQSQQDAATKRRAAQMEARQKLQSSAQNIQDMTPEERQAAIQKMQKDVQDAMDVVMEGENKALEALLTKSQVARLRQLDLQWRTALALNDPKLADQVGLTTDQKQQIAAIYQEYQTGQRQAMSSAFGGFGGRRGNRGGNGANGGNAGNGGNGGDTQGNADPNTQPSLPDPTAIQERLQQAMKDVDKARKTSSDKVAALLTPEQKAIWTKMTGHPFVFKADAPPTIPGAPGN
jgi:hypothetical protein